MSYLQVLSEKKRKTVIVSEQPIKFELVEGANVLIEPELAESLRQWLSERTVRVAASELGVSTGVVMALRRHLGVGA